MESLLYLLSPANPWYYLILACIIAWTIPWKGVALWKAAKNNHSIWFVVLLIFNTLAILEILYIFVFSRKRAKKTAKKKRRK
ncbi:MAG: DUF5652 family protein [Candidatus Paceibacterota bacterium]